MSREDRIDALKESRAAHDAYRGYVDSVPGAYKEFPTEPLRSLTVRAQRAWAHVQAHSRGEEH